MNEAPSKRRGFFIPDKFVNFTHFSGVKIEDEIRQARFRSDHQKAIVNLMYTASWLNTRQETFFKPFGITPSQFNILRILRGQAGKSLTGAEIKERMLERNSDISRLLERMARKNYIKRTRCPHDKRATNITITKTGLSILNEIDVLIDQTEKDFFKLNPREARELSALLDKARG
ncbi:MAG: MarR family transcriptional regulator [Cyclobacteriaceae bacterium]|nr:MarR family transcriptional regulator [Cyclobacteriaceae bacterium]